MKGHRRRDVWQFLFGCWLLANGIYGLAFPSVLPDVEPAAQYGGIALCLIIGFGVIGYVRLKARVRAARPPRPIELGSGDEQ
ncbi:hypothetical protein [Haloarchaeobius sp. DFWS5]|uniref:hypothetical protein n=1 Tax=Haloarchaeobius sp. DFWS5 TaxID=3446114 RepID=UPI003EBD15B8